MTAAKWTFDAETTSAVEIVDALAVLGRRHQTGSAHFVRASGSPESAKAQAPN